MNILMKRFVSVCVLGAALMGATTVFSAALSAKFQVGPTGEIVYGDGTTVSNGERWALVFTASGYTFSGFTTDGHLVDSSHSLVDACTTIDKLRESIQRNVGSTSKVKTNYKDKLGCDDGIFELFLLDSRISDGFAPIDKTNRLPTTINAWAKAEGSNSIKLSELTYDAGTSSTSGSITTTQKTIIGTVIPIPVLVSMVFTNGVATVGATNTASTANYCLKGSLDVTFTNTVWSCANQKGAADVATPLYFSDTDATNSAAFYRIEVVK